MRWRPCFSPNLTPKRAFARAPLEARARPGAVCACSQRRAANSRVPRKSEDVETRKEARLSHNVYVVELDFAVLRNGRFRARNPNYRKGAPCVYVGMTGLPP